jgi:ATP-binding cassette, subfamily F, member 3
VIQVDHLSLQHGSQILFRDASFRLLPGSRTGLVGANGSGKTTVFRLLTGEEHPDQGEISKPKRTVIGYFSQDVGDMSGRTALEEVVAVAGDVARLAREMAELEHAMAEPQTDEAMAALLVRYGEAAAEFEHRGGYDLETRARTMLGGLGIGPDRQERPVETFSGGWKMRIALARILTLVPDVLLLDEPTNHLDVESIIWLEEWLATEFRGALLMTSHDRDFMNRVCDRTLEIANRTITTYGGNYDFYVREREVRRQQLLASHRRQQEMLAKEEAFIARFAARASHASQVQSRIKQIEKIERIEIPPELRTIRFEFPEPPRGGDDVARLEELAKAWPLPDGGEQSVFGGVTGLIRRQEKIAVVGVNGAGKSTFLKVLAGLTPPSGGRLALGAGIEIGYFSQHALDLLDPKKTVFETLQDALPMTNRGTLCNLGGAFLFHGDEIDKQVLALSGGERSRVVLATLLARPRNLLILDEPTNHLDIQSRDVLLDALRRFTGTVVLVSHDRMFLRALVTRVFQIDHGSLRAFEGNYQYYLDKVHAEGQAFPAAVRVR